MPCRAEDLRNTAFVPVLLAGAICATALADDGAIVGLDDLIARLGAGNQPTGAGVVVAQAEADDPPASGLFYPNQSHAEFVGKTFIEQSGPSGVSGHATTVGRDYYGTARSIAPGIPTIHVYSAGGWLQGDFLQTTTPDPPLPGPTGLRVSNHSWVGSAGDPTIENEVLRRADYVAVRDNHLVVSAVNNPGSNFSLLSHSYNGIVAGRMDGNHVSDPTMAGIDGPGRMKPEIVAPGAFTSYAAPVVAAAAALMVETTESLGPGVSLAGRSEVIKAALLAGAVHRPGWTNNPSTSGSDRGRTATPLDAVYGADLLNVDRSHQILTSGQAPSGFSPATAPLISRAGWDLSAVEADGSRFWRFRLDQSTDDISILATWSRDVDPTTFTTWASADFEITLWADTGSGLVGLVGADGLSEFVAGNVVSDSAVDNIEHLFITGLDPGEYVIELRRKDHISAHLLWDVAIAWYWPEPGRVGDLNDDDVVNVLDLLDLLTAWGACLAPEPCDADLNGDDVVDVLDLLIQLANWG